MAQPTASTTEPAAPLPSARTWALTVFACAIVCYAVYLARAAHEVAAGNGLTTRSISPPVLVFLHGQGRAQPPWPSATRAPLPVLFMGGLMRVISEPWAVALSSGIFFLLSVPLIYLIGHRLAGRAAGLLGSVTYMVSPAGLWYGVSGMTESSSIFSLSAIVYLLMGELTWGGCLLAGAAAGLGFLGRTTFKLWAPVIIGYILWRTWRQGPARSIGLALLFIAPLFAAWLWFGVTMQHATGKFGYFGQQDISLRRDTGLYPGRSSSLALESWSAPEFIMQNKGVMARKYARIAEQAWPAVVKMGAMPFLVCFFIVELFLMIGGVRRGTVHWLIYALLLLQLLLTPLASFGNGGVGENRYLDPFAPLAGVLGAAFAVDLLRRKELARRLAVLPLAAIIVLTAIPTLSDLAVGPYHEADTRTWDETGGYLASHAAAGDVVASTHEAMTAWKSNLHSVGLPITPEQLLRMDREMLAVDWIYIQRRGGDNADRTLAWEPVISGDESLPGFEIDHDFPGGAILLHRTP